MTRLGRVVAIVSLFTIPTPSLMAQWAPLASDANVHKRIEWWREARIGLFMHWGVYSGPRRVVAVGRPRLPERSLWRSST